MSPVDKSVDNPVEKLLARQKLASGDLASARVSAWEVRRENSGNRRVLEALARLLDTLNDEMAPSMGDEWSDPACNTNFWDARALLAEILR